MRDCTLLLVCDADFMGEWFPTFRKIVSPSSLRVSSTRRIFVIDRLNPENEVITIL
jgi:hypothetical protein